MPKAMWLRGTTTFGLQCIRAAQTAAQGVCLRGHWSVCLPGHPISRAPTAMRIILYTFKNNRVMVDWLNSSPLRASALRGLGSPQNTFANESFMDELAAASSADPVDFRLRYLSDPRAKAVLEAEAKRAGWTSRPSAQARQQT